MKLRIVLGFLLLVILLRWFACEPGTDRGPIKHLTNRQWVNKVPDGPKDMVFRLILLGRIKRKMGVVMNASNYRFIGDVIGYRVEGNRLTLTIPQDDAEVTFIARTWPCKNAPKPFDLCLELKRGRQSIILYSQRKATFGADDFEALLSPTVDGAGEAEANGASGARRPAWLESALKDASGG